MIEELTKAFDGEVGYLEKASPKSLDDKSANAGSGNYTKYWRDIYPALQGQAWCLCFVIWAFVKAFGLDTAKKLLHSQSGWSFYTPTLAQRFSSAGKLYYGTPQAGDLVFFGDAAHKAQGRYLGIYHIEYIYKVDGNIIYTIGGNTNGSKTPLDAAAKQSEVIANGGGVFYKKYDITNKNIYFYYARPGYADLEPIKKYTVGWHKDDRGWWYANSECSYIAAGWLTVNHARYYFDAEGYAVTGLQSINGKRYVFESTPGAPKECALMETTEDGSLQIKYIDA